jgi:GT2 family glycosyltransferase
MSSCRLSPYLLLLVGSVGVDVRSDAALWQVLENGSVQLDATILPHPAPTEAGDTLIFVREPRIGLNLHDGSLVLRTPENEISLEPAPPEATFVDVQTLAREYFALADDGGRSLVLASFLRGTAHERRSRRRLSESLFQIRELVRTPLPTAAADPGEPRTAHVDAILRLDATAFYVEGRVMHEDAELTSLVAMSPEGERVELVSSAYRFPHPDVAEVIPDGLEQSLQPGFVAFFELANPSLLRDGWVLEMRDSDGGAVEVAMPPVLHHPFAARAKILDHLSLEPVAESRLKAEHILPAIERLEAQRRLGIAVATIDQHGTPPTAPDVSLVVVLRRPELLEQQLAQFVHDDEIAKSDLIYVLDIPENAERVRALADDLHRLYEVPFRLATLTARGGLSIASNLGAELARGHLLVLFDSAVIPDRAGWLHELVEFYEATPDIGALSPMLLYEDDSIRQAGMYFDRQTARDLWSSERFFEGLHRELPAANEARPVPAVSGACLMLAKELWDQMRGLRTEYIQGECAETDLCLRLMEDGRSNWYLPSVALYHLAQPDPSPERELESQYDRWLLSHLWNERIRQPLLLGAGATL